MVKMEHYKLLELLRDSDGLAAGEISTRLNGLPLELVRDDLEAVCKAGWVVSQPTSTETGEGLPAYRLTRSGEKILRPKRE